MESPLARSARVTPRMATRLFSFLVLLVAGGLILNVFLNDGLGPQSRNQLRQESALDARKLSLRTLSRLSMFRNATYTAEAPFSSANITHDIPCPSGFLGLSVTPQQESVPDALFEFSQLYLSVDRALDILTKGVKNDARLRGDPDLHMVNSFVNLGANDGKTHDPLYDLAISKDPVFSGLAVECDLSNIENLRKNIPSGSIIKLHGCVSVDNVGSMLSNATTEWNFDVLKIDIDSLDCEILEKVLILGYLPKLLSVEIAYAFPPPIRFNTLAGEGHSCSLAYLSDLVVPRGYTLLQLDHIDALYVRNEYLHLFPDCPHDDKSWYDQGFTSRVYEGNPITGDPKAPKKGTPVVAQANEFPYAQPGGVSKMEQMLALESDHTRLAVIRTELTSHFPNSLYTLELPADKTEGS